MSEGPEIATLLPKALKELSTAMKAIAFYPAHHPAVVSSLERLIASLRETLARRDPLRVGVSEAAFLVSAEPLAPDDRMLAGFAAYLSRRGIGVIEFRSPLEPEPLRALLEVMALDPRTIQARGGPARCLGERRIAGTTIEEFDPATLVRSAQTGAAEALPGPGAPPAATPARTSWSSLLARFLTGRDRTPPPGGVHLIRRVAADEMAARELTGALRAAVAGPGAGAALASAFGRIAAEVATSEPEVLPALAENLGKALEDLEPGEALDVLQSSIPVPGQDLDLAREIRSRLRDERVGDLIVSLVRSEKRLTPRLATVVRKVLTDTPSWQERRASVQEAIRSVRGPEDDPLADLWKSIEELLEESQDTWISREYKGFLELLGTQTPEIDPSLRRELDALPGFREALTSRGIELRTWILFGDLLEIDREPARLWVALDQIQKRAATMDAAWLGPASEVSANVRNLLETTPAPPAHVAEAATTALRAVAERAVAIERRGFHSLTASEREALPSLFEALGPHAVEPLIAGLKIEEDWEIRKTFIGFLAARGRQAIPALVACLSDPSWYLVRNAAVVLGEIGDPGTLQALAPLLRHAEPRVRRDAVTALGKIGGPRAFALLQTCLGDREVGEIAVRALAAIDRPRTIAAFLDRTARVSLLGRGSRQLREAIETLGALGAHESIPRLQSVLLRGSWLPPGAGDVVRIAAARALERIGTVDALKAVERGTRLWRRPVRAVCAEIVGLRSGRLSPDRGAR